MKDDPFLDIVKASTHTPGIREWFEKIILCENDNKFDELCQNINQKILEKLIDRVKDCNMKLTDQAKSKVSFNIKIFEMVWWSFSIYNCCSNNRRIFNDC